MKKSFLYGLIASVSMVSFQAYADPVPDATSSALTTKGYVDAGLKYVYDVAEGTENGTVKTLKNTIGNTAMGTSANTVTGAINELNTTINGDGTTSDGLVGDVANLQEALDDGTGNLVDVGALKQTVDGLSQNSAIDGANNGVRISNKKIQLDVGNTGNTTYVYKTNELGTGGSWEALEVEDSWDPGFLTTP